MPIAALAPSLISAGTSLIGGFLGSSASKKAAAQQAAASAAAQGKIGDAVSGAQKGMGEAVGIGNDQIKEGRDNANTTLANVFSGQQANLQPYLDAGKQGVTSLADLFKGGGAQFSFSGDDLANTPGYQFQRQQGLDAIKRQAAAGSGAGSGGTLASLMKYGQGLADTTYGEAYNRALNTFQTNRTNTMQGLMTLLNAGQTGTAQYNDVSKNFGNSTAANDVQAGFGQSSNTIGGAQYGGDVGIRGATSIADLITGAGNARAAGTVGSANAWNGALGGVGNAATGYGQSRTLSSLFNNSSTAGPGGVATRPFYSPGTNPSGIGPSPSMPWTPSAPSMPSWMMPGGGGV